MRADALGPVSMPPCGASNTRRTTPRHNHGPDNGTGPRGSWGLEHHHQVGPTIGDRAGVRLTGPRGRPRPPRAADLSGCPVTPLCGRRPGGMSRHHARRRARHARRRPIILRPGLRTWHTGNVPLRRPQHLPFGWTHTPAIAVAVLARYLAVTFPGEIIIIQYVDDILLVAANRTALAQCTNAFARDLEHQGWRVSPKSQMTPSVQVSWMGKDLHGGQHTIIQSATYMATVAPLWLRLGIRGYDARAMRRLCGKIVWASRPGRGAMPFMNGAFAWLNWGPPMAKYTPAVLQGPMEAIAVCMIPWAAPAPPAGSAEQWYVDAALDAGQWLAALWTPDRGVRVLKLPLWVHTQQGAELAAIEAAIRVAAHERLHHIQPVADNMAAIWATKRTKTSMANPDRARHLRRIQHLLRWSHLRVHMSWVASRFNPADSPSRLDKYESAIHMMADAEATYQALRKLPQHSPRALGWVHYRG